MAPGTALSTQHLALGTVMIQLSSLSKSFGERVLLDAVTWQIDDRERVALCGPNGAGKTTLLKMLAGLEEPDGGDVVKPSNLTIGYLPQDGLAHQGRTVFGEASLAFAPLLDMKAEMHALEERMGAADVSDDEQAAMLDRYAELSDRFRLGEGYTIDLQVATVLTGLGFSREDYERPADTFSGGWQMRIALAKLLLGRPGLLLLDEPTNHLDLDARNWLESYLREYPHAVILVSHDRFFLDAVVTQDRRPEPADDHRLPRQLQRLPGRTRRAARAAARGQEGAGRGGRAHQDVRRSLPLPGDQGRAGAEPDQAARQGRAHRGAAGAQACALHVSGRAQERADGDRARRTSGRRTGRSPCSTTCRCTSSAAIASRLSAPTAPASRR